MGWGIKFHSNFQSIIYANDLLEEEDFMSSDVNKHSAKVGIKRFSTACLFRLKIQNTEPSIHWVEFTSYMKTTHSFQRHNLWANEWVNEWAKWSAAERTSDTSSAEWANAWAISYHFYSKYGRTISSKAFHLGIIPAKSDFRSMEVMTMDYWGVSEKK